MAGVGLAPDDGRWSTAQLRGQFFAIAQLRWRMTVNGFRRKGGAGELIGRIITYPMLAGLAIGPTIGACIGSYFMTANGKLQYIALLLWGVFVICQLLNINLGQPGSTFDPTQLIRFPMRSGTYTAIRLFFGLLTPANVIGTLMSFAIAVGILVARPGLWLYALVTLAVFAATNVLFSRMVFAWVDRWLSTRRAREVFTGIIFLVSMSAQLFNFAFNPAYNRHHQHQHTSAATMARVNSAQNFYHHAQPVLALLPPGLTGAALTSADAGRSAAFLANTLGCAAFAAIFLVVFALRMKTEFRGENLSDVANAVARQPATPARTLAPVLDTTVAEPERRWFGLPAMVPGMLAKEILYVRRNTGILYGLVAPLVMVVFFSMKWSARGGASWILPAAMAYALLGVSPLSYNSFGQEAAGAQFYFMAPIRLRDVFLAKNLINFALAFLEITAIIVILSFVSAVPSAVTIATGVLWAAATLLLTTTLGNRRSITAPKKVLPGKMANKQTSQLSGLISLGVMAASASFGALLFFAAFWFNLAWLPLPFVAVYAAVALFVYERGLRSIDAFALAHRDELFEELCKQ